MSRATEVERLMSRATGEAGLMSRPTEVERLMSSATDGAGLMSRPTDEARLMIRRATGTARVPPGRRARRARGCAVGRAASARALFRTALRGSEKFCTCRVRPADAQHAHDEHGGRVGHARSQ